MKVWPIVVLTIVCLVTGAAPARADDYPNACLAADNQRTYAVQITVDGYPGRTWTYEPGDKGWLTLRENDSHVRSANGAFTIHLSERGQKLPGDNQYVSWEYRAGLTDSGACNGTWVATIHN